MKTPTMLKARKTDKTPTESTTHEGGPDPAYIVKPPSPAKRTAQETVERAHHSKVNATDAWVNGHISSKEHTERHKRANHVIASKGRVDAIGSKTQPRGKRIAGGFKK